MTSKCKRIGCTSDAVEDVSYNRAVMPLCASHAEELKERMANTEAFLDSKPDGTNT